MSAWSDIRDSGNLLLSHRYADGVAWSYIGAGLLENSEGPRANSTGLVNDVFSTFGADLRQVSQSYDLPIELLATAVCMIAELVGATDAAAYVHYLDGFVSDDKTPELAFVGCTGLRFDRVRSIRGPVRISNYIADPVTAIDTAAQHILASVQTTNFQPPLLASAFNTDGIMYDGTSRWRMSPASQIDRFVAWWNATVAALHMDPTLIGLAPSYTAELLKLTPALPPAPSSPQTTQVPYRLPESKAALDAGMMAICESNPSLSTIWALDDLTTQQIGNVAKDAASGMGLPLGQPAFAYPDRGGVMRVMTAEEVQKVYKAMRDYVTQIIMYDTGRAPSLPGQPVLIT